MKNKLFTLLTLLLFGTSMSWAGTTTYDFTGKTQDTTPTISTTAHHRAANSQNVFVVTAGEGTDKFCFQKVGKTDGFFYSSTNLSQTKGDRYFSIIDLSAGDEITITYTSAAAGSSSGDFTIANSGNSGATNLSLSKGGDAIAAGTVVTSGTTYYVLSDGYVDFLTKKNFYLTEVTINHEEQEIPANGLSYAIESLTKNIGAENFTNPLTNLYGLSVSYSITTNGTGSSIDANTGEVTIGSTPGTETINATFDGNATYPAGTVSYTLTVIAVCAAPVITCNSVYNYEKGGYEFVATCATEGATLQYRLKSDANYTSCTNGVPFYVAGDADSNDKLIVKATKSGYTEKATTTSYYLNKALASTSPEVLIPFFMGDDNTFKNHAYKYRSVTIGEDNSASTIGGAVNDSTLKIRTNQTHDLENAAKIYVHNGYKVTGISVRAYSNNKEATINLAGVYVDNTETNILASAVTFPVLNSSSQTWETYSNNTIEANDYIILAFDNSNIDPSVSSKKNSQIVATITITYEILPVNLTLGRNGWSTYAADFAYSVSGATAYKAAYSAGVVTLTEITGVVPAGEGIILKGTEGDPVTITPSNETPDALEDNDLVGVLAAETAPTGAYAIATLIDIDKGEAVETTKFYPCAGIEIPAHKAYLNTGAATAPALRIEFAENNATDVNAVEAGEQTTKFFRDGMMLIMKNGVVYDVLGNVVK